jgi:TPR repeat protein
MRILFAALLSLCLLATPALADFNQGKVAYDTKQWREAIANLRPAAERGDARAMVLLGNMYAYGFGVDKDDVEAFLLYRRAAEKDNKEGIIATAAFYQEGRGVSKNTRLAIEWFERGAKMGDQTCAFFYAIHLYQGSKGDTFDFKPNHAESYKWFLIASEGTVFPKMAQTSENMAKQIGEKLNALERAAAERGAREWRPMSPAQLGPAPDLELIENEEPAQKTDAAEDQTEAPAEAAPEDSKEESADAPEKTEPEPAEKAAE